MSRAPRPGAGGGAPPRRRRAPRVATWGCLASAAASGWAAVHGLAGAWVPSCHAPARRLAEAGAQDEASPGRREALAQLASGSAVAAAAVGTDQPAWARTYVGVEEDGPTGPAIKIRNKYNFYPMIGANATLTTPGGLEYQRLLEPMENGTKKLFGPPDDGAVVTIKYEGHLDGFDGPIFDSSYMRGLRRPLPNPTGTKADKIRAIAARRGSFNQVEIQIGKDKSITPGVYEVLKSMRVGERTRFVQPPSWNYLEGKKAYAGHPDSNITEIPAGTTTYYNLELLIINNP